MKYSRPQSTVQLQSGRADNGLADGVRFSVRSRVGDAGVRDATQVFTRYYRSGGTQRQPGAGLGLCLLQNLASKMASTIDMRVAGDELIFSLQVGTAA